MCGWVGQFGRCPDTARLKRAGETLASRGPDGTGERIIDTPTLRAGLAHRRLAILDPSPAGAQPMHDDTRGITIIYNGEIYNSPELRRELQAAGCHFRSSSDTEVLLLGWAEWGDALLDRIRGIFSFALIDERRGRVLLARDRLGVKPLYWAHVGDTLVAASAPRAILALEPELRSDLDRVALAQFLTLLWIPHPRTPWTRIHKLPPGTALSWEAGASRECRYWQPVANEQKSLDPAELRDVLRDAAVAQLLSDVPVGLLLSGGLDSTLLLEFIAGEVDDLRAVTAGYSARDQRFEIAPDDLQFARLAAAAHPRVDLREVEIGADALDDVDTLAFHFDDPVADPAAISLYRLARAADTKVLLSGVGGEELFAGYPRHMGLPTAVRLARAPALARSSVTGAGRWLQGGRPGPLYAVRRNAEKLARALGGEQPHYWQMMSQLSRAEVESLLPDAAAPAWAELDHASTPLMSTSLSDALAFDRSQFLPNLNLAYVDKAAMAAGVEVRVPLLDERVVDLVDSIPVAALVEDRDGKMPLRSAARGVVPDAIIDRPKSGFGGPARAWFRDDRTGGLRDRVDALADSGLVERPAALRVLNAAASGRRDAALAAWALVALQAWQAEHVAGGDPR